MVNPFAHSKIAPKKKKAPVAVIEDRFTPSMYAVAGLEGPGEAPHSWHAAKGLITGLLEFVGEDPSREGLRETPERVLKAWQHWCKGYKEDPAAVLKTFEDGAEGVDEMVMVGPIQLYSHCEHHLAPFHGDAWVAYIPNGRVVGLSKLARVVDIFAHRLQVQERLTNQIANAIDEELKPLGVGVIIRASHMCMCSRGVNKQGAFTTTSALRGAIKEKGKARAEFLRLAGF